MVLGTIWKHTICYSSYDSITCKPFLHFTFHPKSNITTMCNTTYMNIKFLSNIGEVLFCSSVVNLAELLQIVYQRQLLRRKHGIIYREIWIGCCGNQPICWTCPTPTQIFLTAITWCNASLEKFLYWLIKAVKMLN